MSEQDVVRDYIKAGKFPTGHQIPPERELAAMLGLTRNQVRSALKILERDGLIWRHVGKGTFIGARPEEEIGQRSTAEACIADLSNPHDVIEARLVIEPMLARLAASRANQLDLTAMEKKLEELSQAKIPEVFHRLDKEWHLLIANAGRNNILSSFLSIIQQGVDTNSWGRLVKLYLTTDRMSEAVHEHQALYQAIRSRDPGKAEELMRQHIRSVRTSFSEFE